MSRYKKSQIFSNESEMYQDILDSKNLSNIRQYTTFNFNKLKNFNDNGISYVTHKFGAFDRLENISYKYYNSVEYWWIICYTNKISNPLEIKIGQLLKIYFPLESLLELL